MQIPKTVASVCSRLRQARHEAYVVGGCVRDALLGRAATDWDVATSALPAQVAELFPRTIPTGMQHGTVTVLHRGMSMEVTTFRSEGPYTDGRRPDSVRFGVSLEEDLSRRDFTINAMAYEPMTDRLIDPFAGQDDLQRKVVRAVGDPVMRFGEDGLRILRAVRLCAVLEFALDPATEAAISTTLENLRRVSAERVRDELLKLLSARQPSLGLRMAQRTGILHVIVPELDAAVGVVQNRHHAYDVWEHTWATVDATSGDPILKLGALLHDVGKPKTVAHRLETPSEHTFYRHEFVGAQIAEQMLLRLKLSNKDRERVVGMVAHHMFWYTPEWTDATVRRFLRRITPELWPDLVALREADIIGRGKNEDPEVELGELKRRVERMLAQKEALSVAALAIDGLDVMQALGISPGPEVGRVLRELLERVIEDPSLNTRDKLLGLVISIKGSA